jgi:SAM-dependent methyltransferase
MTDPVTPVPRYDVLLFPHAALEESDEFALGMRDLRRRLPGARHWYTVAHAEDAPSPAAFSAWSDAPYLLVILNPALLVSDNLEQELLALADVAGVDCVLPGDPRGCGPGIFINYASRPGFDRFVARLSHGQRQMPFDGRTPWLYLISRQALTLESVGEAAWQQLPAQLGPHTIMAGHAFIHSYADYYRSDRAEMLRLIPEGVRTLLEVGGGLGGFCSTFMKERGGRATLLEQNPVMAAAARESGLDVLEGDFHKCALPERYDCVVFLDVLEHLPDPLAALLKARQALQPGGCLLLSVPNVGHWSVVWDLLEGRFEYLPLGILCTTHLRFFTRSSLEALLTDTGFVVERWENSASPLPESFAAFLAQRPTAGITPDHTSLATDSFHILARCSDELKSQP